MKIKKIPIILLEDNQDHFKIMKEIISTILSQDFGYEAYFPFEFDPSIKSLTEGRRGAYHLSEWDNNSERKKKALETIKEFLRKIPKKAIAVIDVNWVEDKDENIYGLEFYNKYLKTKVKPVNVISVSVYEREKILKEGQTSALRIQSVSKIHSTTVGKIMFGDVFRNEMREALGKSLPIEPKKFWKSIITILAFIIFAFGIYIYFHLDEEDANRKWLPYIISTFSLFLGFFEKIMSFCMTLYKLINSENK